MTKRSGSLEDGTSEHDGKGEKNQRGLVEGQVKLLKGVGGLKKVAFQAGKAATLARWGTECSSPQKLARSCSSLSPRQLSPPGSAGPRPAMRHPSFLIASPLQTVGRGYA